MTNDANQSQGKSEKEDTTLLTHVNKNGEAHMVDVNRKKIMHREAQACGKIYMASATIDAIKQNMIKKGDVLATARIAGIMGAKKTAELIPLCHNIPIDHIDIGFEILADHISIHSHAICDSKTGIEMEAISAVSIAAITIYDMCKAIDKSMIISEIKLIGKSKHELQ